MADAPHPQRQAKAPGRRKPAPHKTHEQVMKREPEKLNLAHHKLHPGPAENTLVRQANPEAQKEGNSFGMIAAQRIAGAVGPK